MNELTGPVLPILLAQLVGTVGTAVVAGVLTSLLWRWVWRKVHGEDRSWLVDGALIVLLAANSPVSFRMSWNDSDLALTPLWVLGIRFLLTALILLWMRERSPSAQEAEGLEPDGVIRDHDGLTVAYTFKPLALSGLAIALAWSWPFPMLFPAWMWAKGGGLSARLRLRPGELEVTTPFVRSVVALQGATVERERRRDGEAVLRITNGDQRADLPLGGVEAATVAWLRATIDDAIASARPTPLLEAPPEDLRALASAARRKVPVER